MKTQKELAKISKDLVKISRKLQELTSSINKEKRRASKAGIPEVGYTWQKKKIWNKNSTGNCQKFH